MGKRGTFFRSSILVISSPPATKTSLLARAIVLPASIAETVGLNPATPATPTTTMSASGIVLSSHKPSIPSTTLTSVPAKISRASRAASGSTKPISLTPKARACSATPAAFLLAARATIRISSLRREATSNTCRPIEPVEPSTTTRLIPFFDTTSSLFPRIFVCAFDNQSAPLSIRP